MNPSRESEFTNPIHNTASMQPLSGYRVLELGSTVAGPFCGRLLADFGAEVVKVESPQGDPVRTMGEHVDGKSLYAASILRNKKLIALNLRSLKGQELVRQLLPSFDIVIENFRPGTMEKWGLGYDDLKEINPSVIMVRISGFGQSGPYKDRPGYGLLGDAVGGLLEINGYPDQAPARAAVPITDMTTGLYGAFGALMALLVRQQTGKGQCIDAALYESAFSFMESHVAPYDKLGKVAMRAGSRLPGSTPNNLFPTQEGAYVALAAASDSVFKRLCETMGMPRLSEDARFSTGLKRVENQDELDAIIGAWTQKFSVFELEDILQQNAVPASRVFSMTDIFTDQHYKARETIINAKDGEIDDVLMPVPVPRLSQTPGKVHHAGRAVGADTFTVLQELAGLTLTNLNDLQREGVIFDQRLDHEGK